MSKSKKSSNFFKDMLQITNAIDSKSLERAAGGKLGSTFPILPCSVRVRGASAAGLSIRPSRAAMRIPKPHRHCLMKSFGFSV
jgi:hypothetical protein